MPLTLRGGFLVFLSAKHPPKGFLLLLWEQVPIPLSHFLGLVPEPTVNHLLPDLRRRTRSRLLLSW